MSTTVEVPTLGESVTEAVLVQWHKKDGDRVAVDEPLCELESDKATIDLPAPASGILHPQKNAGETARVGEVIAQIDEEGKPAAEARFSQPAAKEAVKAADHETAASKEPQKAQPENASKEAPSPPPTAPSEEPKRKQRPEAAPRQEQPKQQPQTKERPPDAGKAPVQTASPARQPAAEVQPAAPSQDGVRREPMSKIRRRIAERLVRATQTTAMLTTFNEIDMTTIQNLRNSHQERFREAHGVSLGLMSFFARATVQALKQFPALNAQIDGDDIVYHDFIHLGIAVSTERGLVVPVLRNVETLSLARIEKEIKRSAAAIKEGKLTLAELSGGTFTITNGGVFGSLLSTPILNPPQSGILGMHVIQERPVAINRQVEVRPMMYIALTYDHRLVDGQQSVSFLVKLKQLLEDPVQMMLEI